MRIIQVPDCGACLYRDDMMEGMSDPYDATVRCGHEHSKGERYFVIADHITNRTIHPECSLALDGTGELKNTIEELEDKVMDLEDTIEILHEDREDI